MRSPRRTFAAPFVITLGACATQPPPPQPIHENPPAPAPVVETPPPEPVAIHGNPPPPPPEPEPPRPVADKSWTVMMQGGTCSVRGYASCPKPEPGKPMRTCNPPAPQPYECPRGMTDGENVTIVKRNDSCVIPSPHVSCPAGAMCNPPPPRPVPCPTY